MKITLIILVTVFASAANSANILFFFASGTWSHKVSIWPLVTALADRGHHVTYISGHQRQPYNSSKVNDLFSVTIANGLKGIYNVDRIADRLAGTEMEIFERYNADVVGVCRLIYGAIDTDPALNYVLRQGQFDLVVNNVVVGDCGLLVAAKNKAKLIISASTTLLTWLYDEFGFPDEPATIPDMPVEFWYPMSFWNRLYNYLLPIYWSKRREREVYPALEAIMKRAYGLQEVPSLLEVQKNASLILLSSHYSTDFARSFPPMVVNIGGMQCWQKISPMPENFQKIMDNAVDGVILIAFGSTVNLARMPPTMKGYFFEMMRNFPKTVFIWRWDGPEPENPPKNLILSKWLPQMQILAHPNCKGFISHAGLNSITEATFNGVPIILLPLFADQDYNAYRVQADEVGIRLEIRELSSAKITDAVGAILTNEKYRVNMKILSGILKDRPMSPIDAGVYWIEFVLRHEDTKSLKPLNYLPMYKRRHWDVLFVIFLATTTTFLALLFIASKTFKFIFSKFSGKSSSSSVAKKRN